MLRSVYVSYDGALDPLGASQVVPYLLGLSRRGVAITLVSFEKEGRWADQAARALLADRFATAGIGWRPLRYHRRPRVPATLWDMLAGSRAIAAEARRSGAAIVHCRGDVAMAMARWARLARTSRLVYDVRGFWSDERVESGSWRRGSLLDRAVRRVEAANLQGADGVVVLTKPAWDALAPRLARPIRHRIIPTCADTDLYRPRLAGEAPDLGLVYSGSLGSWYMADQMIAFAREAAPLIPGRALFLTPQPEAAHRAGATPDWAEVRTAAPGEVPAWLRRCRAAFFFYQPTPARRATCPTKLAEALATGLPVVVNRGIGDLDDVVESERVGVLLEAFTPEAYRAAAGRLAQLLTDPLTPERCRRLAEVRYDVEAGVAGYRGLYEELSAPIA